MELNEKPDRDKVWNGICTVVYAYPEFRKLPGDRQKFIINEIIDHMEDLINMITKDDRSYPWNRKED